MKNKIFKNYNLFQIFFIFSCLPAKNSKQVITCIVVADEPEPANFKDNYCMFNQIARGVFSANQTQDHNR